MRYSVIIDLDEKEGVGIKKFLISAIAVVLAVGVGYFAYRYAHPEMQQQTATVSSAASLQTASSSAVGVADASSQAAPALKAGAASSVAKTPVNGAKQAEIGKIQKAVAMDWSKYTLRASAPKTIKNRTYDAYDISDEDSLVGPKILVDQTSGKIYTWASTDAAPVPIVEDKAFDKTVKTVTGTVEDGAMMNVMLKTADGNELIVRRLGVDTSGLKSLKIGDKIKVTYTGVINGSDTSRAFITKIENVK